jgi:hypothetical protein
VTLGENALAKAPEIAFYNIGLDNEIIEYHGNITGG